MCSAGAAAFATRHPGGVSDTLLWDRVEHTSAKHRLLRAFFDRWVSVHAGTFARRGGGSVRVFDGFAGPGEYVGGEAGSPLILMRALCSHPHLQRWASVRFQFEFVEKDPARAANLHRVLRDHEGLARSAGKWSETITWTVTEGRYEDNVPGAPSGDSALLLFLDPFGYSHAPMELTRDLVQQPKSDTLIFLPLSHVNRFVRLDGQAGALDRFFGTPAWRDVPDGEDRPRALLTLFEQQLRTAGLRWTLAFRLQPPMRGNEYWIVGASASLTGFDSIKAAYWQVDPVDGQGFIAPRRTRPGQQSFDLEQPAPSLEANTAPLLSALRARFGTAPFSVEDAVEFTATTRFRVNAHLRNRTLQPAEQDGLLRVERPAGAQKFSLGRGIRMRFVGLGGNGNAGSD